MAGLAWRSAARPGIEPEPPAKTVDRLEFGPLDTADPGLARLRETLPADVRVQPIDAAILERCEWRDLTVDAFGTTEAFLATGYGLVLMRDDEILAEAYAPFLGHGVAEIGVVTAEPHRGHGYAPIACAYLAATLAGAGYAMSWSCDSDNEPSVRVAQKLGFAPARPYALFLYRPMPA